MRFAGRFKRHVTRWAKTSGLAEFVEEGRPWVLQSPHQDRNMFRPTWWSHLKGREHQWARALNSSQCFAINLFAPLVNSPAAVDFVHAMAPDLGVREQDQLRVSFEQSPLAVAERVGERNRRTQMDVLLEVFREQRLLGVIGIEVKLTEKEFGGCRGFSGRGGSGSVTNPDRSRCLDGRRVFETPEQNCFMAEGEGRRYWRLIKGPDSAFDLARLASLEHCPFRHGLYQLMRNRVALDALRAITGAEWCEFVVCGHSSNQDARLLPESVAGEFDAIEAFRRLTGGRGVVEWDPDQVVSVIDSIGAGPEGWASWVRSKYLLEDHEPPLRERQSALDAPPDHFRTAQFPNLESDVKLDREIQKRLAAFLAVANRQGIEKIGPSIERVFIKGEPDTPSEANKIERQLRRWVETSPTGRHADAIPAAEALYAILFDPAERQKFLS